MVGSGGHGRHGIHHVQDLCRPLHFQTHTHCYQLHVRHLKNYKNLMVIILITIVLHVLKGKNHLKELLFAALALLDSMALHRVLTAKDLILLQFLSLPSIQNQFLLAMQSLWVLRQAIPML